MKRIKTHTDLVEAIRELVAYNFESEYRDYMEQKTKRNHIFNTIQALDIWARQEEEEVE
jgi:hypothetical protein